MISDPAQAASDTPPHPGSPVTQSLQRNLAARRGLFVHLFIFAVAAVNLLVINLLTNRDTIWAVWPIGVWAIVLAAHVGFSVVNRGFFGIHLFGGAAICVGLAVINVFHGRYDASMGGWWVIWPILAWLLSLIIHLPFAFDLISAARSDARRSTPPTNH
ncbi:MAG: 2TM domain-containing protein [Thermomicrobiales bacterium]